MVTPNQMIVGMLTWLIGTGLKRIKGIPNDMLPQILYYVSIGASYAMAVLTNLIAATPAHAADGPVPMPPPAAPAVDGTISWVLVNAWDWLGRKVLWGKLLKKILK